MRRGDSVLQEVQKIHVSLREFTDERCQSAYQIGARDLLCQY